MVEAGERGQMQRGGVCEKAEGCVTAGPDVAFGIEAQWLYRAGVPQKRSPACRLW